MLMRGPIPSTSRLLSDCDRTWFMCQCGVGGQRDTQTLPGVFLERLVPVPDGEEE